MINKKSEIREKGNALVAFWGHGDFEKFESEINHVLGQKNKFPLLEALAHQFSENLSPKDTLAIAQLAVDLNHIGSYPFAGILLQGNLSLDLPFTFSLARKLIMQGNVWYASDTIAERVVGVGLLKNFNQAYPQVQEFSQDTNPWIRRSVGVGIHLATKWGLAETEVRILLRWVLERAPFARGEEQTGLGWGLKTIAKFHPGWFQKPGERLPANMPVWAKKKIQTGLAIAAKRNQKDFGAKG